MAFIGTSVGRKVTWNRVVTNGGGYINGFSTAVDGTIFCRTDTQGAYKWDGSKWQQILSQNQIGYPEFEGYRCLAGVPDLQVAPSNSSIVYALYNDAFYNNRSGGAYLAKSTDAGASFTTLPSYPVNSATQAGTFILGGADLRYKRVQNKVGIDPADPNTVYATNPGGNPLVSFNGGASFSIVPNLPVGTGLGAHAWLFDTSSGTTNGRTNTIYCVVQGSGLWQSTNAGVSFTQIVSSAFGTLPAQFCSISSDGVAYFGEGAYQGATWAIYRWQTGVWTTLLSGSGQNYPAVAAHQSRLGVVCFAMPGSTIYYSSDYGTTRASYITTSQSFTSSDAPWWANQCNGAGMSSGMLLFRGTTDELFLSKGQGICKTTIVGTAPSSPITFASQQTGIENWVCNKIVHESGTNLLQVGDDICGFIYPTNDLATARTHCLDYTITGAEVAIIHGWSAAIDPWNTNNQVIVSQTANECGYSTNGGSTWTKFTNLPGSVTNGDLQAGMEVMISNGVIMWLPAMNAAATGKNTWFRTTDWGLNWAAITGPTNIPATGTSGWGFGSVLPKSTGFIDGSDPSTFYIYNYLNPPAGIRGLYKSTDAGVTFSSSPISDPFSGQAFSPVQFRCVPGLAGYIFATAGYVSSSSKPNISAKAYYSTNGGTSWTQLANMLEINYFGFGKAFPSFQYPSLLVAGFYYGRYGIYLSKDLGQSWVPVASSQYGPWPLHNDAVQSIDGDKDIVGRFYVGFRGSGVCYCDLA